MPIVLMNLKSSKKETLYKSIQGIKLDDYFLSNETLYVIDG